MGLEQRETALRGKEKVVGGPFSACSWLLFFSVRNGQIRFLAWEEEVLGILRYTKVRRNRGTKNAAICETQHTPKIFLIWRRFRTPIGKKITHTSAVLFLLIFLRVFLKMKSTAFL